MKRILVSLLITLTLIACNAASNDNPPDPKKDSNDKTSPVVTLAASDTEFRSPGTLTLTVTATDNIGVSKVEFYEEDVNVDLKGLGLEPLAENKIAEDTTEPFTLELPINNGEYIVRTFRAKALDEAGNVGSSLAVTVAINIELGSLEVHARIGSNYSVSMEFNELDIRVTGPNGFEVNITNKDTYLRDLEFGTYTLTPSDAVGLHSVVNAYLAADTQTVELSPGNSYDSVAVQYEPRPDTNKLWLAVRGENKLVALNNFSPVPASPAIAIGTGARSGPDSVAFDKAGNLWMAARDANKVMMFTPAQLAVSGTPAATVILDGAAFMSSPRGLAFDQDNNLWVTNFASDTVLRYTANEITTSGAPTPDVLTSPDLNAPSDIAFDKDGNFWVANRHLGVVSMFQINDLGTFANVAAKVKLTATSPYGLAFDKDGNLWTSNADHNTLMRFPAQQLNNATVTPDITLSNNNESLATPTGLAFDNSGKLYVTNFATETLALFELPALVATGNPAARLITGIGDIGSGFFAFNLPPNELPLSH